MKPSLISAVVLAASLSVAATAPFVGQAPISADPASSSAKSSANPGSPALSGEERAVLRSVELRDADLSEVKAGFAMSDDDTMLVLGTIAVVLLIALLL